MARLYAIYLNKGNEGEKVEAKVAMWRDNLLVSIRHSSSSARSAL